MERNPFVHSLYMRINKNNRNTKLNNILNKLVGTSIDNYIQDYKIEKTELIFNACIIKGGKIYFVYLITDEQNRIEKEKYITYCTKHSIPILIINNDTDENILEKKLWLFLSIGSS